MAAKTQQQSILTTHQRVVLDAVASEPYFTKRFYLAGGTALAEFYLQHRLSEDLDFFCEKAEINPAPITRFLENHSAVLGIQRIVPKRVLGLYTYFLHFSDGEVLKVDFNYYPFPCILKGVKYKGLTIESMYDIGVDKVHTITLKPRARDFIDIYFIINAAHYDLKDLLMQAKAKFDWDLSLVDLGARLIEAAEATDFPRMLKPIDHSEWKQFFVDEAKKLKPEIFE